MELKRESHGPYERVSPKGQRGSSRGAGTRQRPAPRAPRAAPGGAAGGTRGEGTKVGALGGGGDATPLLHPTFDLYWRPPPSWAQGRGQGSANSICSKSTVESRAGGRQGGKGRKQNRRRGEGRGAAHDPGQSQVHPGTAATLPAGERRHGSKARLRRVTAGASQRAHWTCLRSGGCRLRPHQPALRAPAPTTGAEPRLRPRGWGSLEAPQRRGGGQEGWAKPQTGQPGLGSQTPGPKSSPAAPWVRTL